MTKHTPDRNLEVADLLSARDVLYPRLVAAIGTDAFRALSDRLGWINERLIELDAIPGITL